MGGLEREPFVYFLAQRTYTIFFEKVIIFADYYVFILVCIFTTFVLNCVAGGYFLYGIGVYYVCNVECNSELYVYCCV